MDFRIADLLVSAKNELKDSGIASYALDAEVLLAELLNMTRTRLFINPDMPVDKDIVACYEAYISKRREHCPVQYIINKCEFMSLPFYVDENALIPRPDTELLVESAIELIKANGYQAAIDLCTGSGCIAVSIAKYCGIKVIAADISEAALAVCKRNIELNNVSRETSVVQSDLFINLRDQTADIIVSNPPYIKTADIAGLDVNVKDYEPVSALDGGADGLYFYKRIINEAKGRLAPNGALLFEIGYDQAADVAALLAGEGYNNISVKKDLSGLDRVVTAFY